jgi:PAS domain S-box-containing protein
VLASLLVARQVGSVETLKRRAEDHLRSANAEIERNRRLLQRVVEISPDVTYVFDAQEFRNVFLSGRVDEVLGYGPEHVRAMGGEVLAQLVHPDDFARVMEHQARVMDLLDGDIATLEYRMRDTSGRYRWLRSKETVFSRTPDGRVGRVLGVATDISDTKAAQDEIVDTNERLQSTLANARQSAAEFKLAFDMIPTLAWQTSPAGTVEALNRRFLDYTGLALEDALSGQWLNAFHPDDAGQVFGVWQECLASGNSGEVEARMQRHDGVYRSFLVRAAPMRDEQGAITRWFGTNIDVEDLKRAERLLAEEKRLLEMVATGRPAPEVLEALCRAVESLTEGTCASILLLDPATRCLRHGAAPSLSERYTAAVDGLLIGPRAGSCGTAAYRSEPVFVADIAADPLWAEHADIRDLALAHDLRACWSSPIWSSAGTVLGTFALYARQARPIAAEEERLVEQFTHIASIAIERGRMDVDLRASLAEKEALLKEVHHRVKNNLQLISSLLSLQAGRIDTPAMAEQFAESRNRVRAMALVHENLYRTGSFARINMAGHIRALCAQLMRAYGLQGQAVALTPQVAEVEFDLDRAVAVGLIVNELVSNALKHAFPDGRAGRVKVRLERQEDGMCCLTVADNGVGLPAELEVEQASTMGLQLLRMLTDQLHGSVAITHEGGTTFTIAFPER